MTVEEYNTGQIWDTFY